MTDFFFKGIENHSVLVAVTISVLGIVAFFIKRWFLGDKTKYPASVRIGFGYMDGEASLDDTYKEVEFAKGILKRKGDVDSFAYFCDVPDGSYAFFCFFYGISNEEKSSAAAKNVNVLLECPAENVVTEENLLDFTELVVLAKLASDAKHSEVNYFKSREVMIVGDMATISYDIPLVRPGEKIMIGEVFKIKNAISNRANHPMHASAVRPMEVVENLLKIGNFIDYFKVKIYVSSENTKREKGRADIYCFHGSTPENISRTMQAMSQFVWITKKIYCVWSPPLFKSLKILIPVKRGHWFWVPPIGSLELFSEPIEIIIPHFEEKLKGKFYFESNPFMSEGNWASFTYPMRFSKENRRS